MQDENLNPDASDTGEEIDHEQSSEETDESTDEVDYKAQAEHYRKIAEKRQSALERISKAQERRAGESGETSSDPDIETIVKKTTETVLDGFKREQQTEMFEEILGNLTDNADEREAIRLAYQEELKPSGFSRNAIQNDLKKALAIVNLPKLESQLRQKVEGEVKKNFAEARQRSEGTSGTSGRRPPDSGVELSPTDQSFVDKFKHAGKMLRGE